jgi:ketosteroid isomerase-like protein
MCRLSFLKGGGDRTESKYAASMSLRDELARCWNALNEGDPNAFLDLYDPEIELFVPAWASPDSGVVRGADAVNRWYAHNFAQWSDQRWEMGETFEDGSNVAYTLHWSARGKRSGVALAGTAFGTMTFHEGKIVTIVHLGFIGDGTT